MFKFKPNEKIRLRVRSFSKFLVHDHSPFGGTRLNIATQKVGPYVRSQSDVAFRSSYYAMDDGTGTVKTGTVKRQRGVLVDLVDQVGHFRSHRARLGLGGVRVRVGEEDVDFRGQSGSWESWEECVVLKGPSGHVGISHFEAVGIFSKVRGILRWSESSGF